MEILVLHPGALGDIILSLPALRVLRDRFQTARVSLAANVDFAEVASGCADELLPLSTLPLHRLFSVEDVPPEDVRLWRSYDRIVSWTGSPCEAFTQKLSLLHPCVIVAAWKPGAGERRHVARLFVDSLRPWLPPPPVMPVPEIRLSHSEGRRGTEWLSRCGWNAQNPLIALHPGAGNASKRWPLEKFVALARSLTSRATLLIVEGPAEPGVGQHVAAAVGTGICVASSLDTRLLAAVLSHCQLFVGNDSGVAHLAAAAGSPCVLIFGPTRAEQWAPIGDRVTILRNTDDCIGCEDQRLTSHTCLDNITVEDALKAASSVMNLGY